MSTVAPKKSTKIQRFAGWRSTFADVMLSSAASHNLTNVYTIQGTCKKLRETSKQSFRRGKTAVLANFLAYMNALLQPLLPSDQHTIFVTNAFMNGITTKKQPQEALVSIER